MYFPVVRFPYRIRGVDLVPFVLHPDHEGISEHRPAPPRRVPADLVRILLPHLVRLRIVPRHLVEAPEPELAHL